MDKPRANRSRNQFLAPRPTTILLLIPFVRADPGKRLFHRDCIVIVSDKGNVTKIFLRKTLGSNGSGPAMAKKALTCSQLANTFHVARAVLDRPNYCSKALDLKVAIGSRLEPRKSSI